ncbi:SDR family NAD(P)-dependent oxidoreductase [Granulicoccus phenolivorans]|uniref:SDR family NAD(P)-dependent oxidoreductase n=1 Tax=Granulicoccus phenolivorans TaxID=266854 RepID=UPI00041CB944|nr:SDR family NAD(P)-dependent oxidoreductase [Granulicoccus phenolivorans]
MQIKDKSFVVTGGASGLGLASAKALLEQGGKVVLLDLPGSAGADVAAELGANARFAPADVTDPAAVAAALDVAEELGEFRGVVHCAGRGGTMRIVDKAGNPGSLEFFEMVVKVNLVGSFNVLSQAAARLAKQEPLDSERGVVVLTSSAAGYEGRIGQTPYASSKAGIIGMTLVAARDLASKGVRVCTIAPGVMDTPILANVPEQARATLADPIPHPRRLGRPEEFGMLARQIVENPYLNGEVIRLDGALRMTPRD